MLVYVIAMYTAGRQPKPTKLKRIARVKDSHILSGACGGNNCCLVCKEGKVFMFGPTEGDIVDKNTGEILHRKAISNGRLQKRLFLM